MTIKGLRGIVGIMFVLAGPAAVNGQGGIDYTKSNVLRNPTFTITIPPGWARMRPSHLESIEEKIAQRVQYGFHERFDYGYWGMFLTTPYGYPYVLVQIRDEGRIPEDELAFLEGASAQDEIDWYRRFLSPIASDIQVGELWYDEAERIIWMNMEARVSGVGRVFVLTGFIPTQTGLIQVSGYSSRRDYVESLREIISSVEPNAALVYRPSTPDQPDLEEDGDTIKIAILVGLVVLLLAFRAWVRK